MYTGKGDKVSVLNNDNLIGLCKEGFKNKDLKGKKVLAIIPDTTRSGPVSLFFKTICEILLPQVSKLDFMIQHQLLQTRP